MEAARRLSSAFVEAHPQDAARVLERLALHEVAEFVAGCPPGAAARILQSLSPALGAACLACVAAGAAARIMTEMALDDAVVVLRLTESAARDAIFDALGPDSAEPFRRLLRFRENTAGALMDPRVLALPEDITAAEALERIRRAAQPVEFYVYIVDRGYRLTGVVTLRDLIRGAGDDAPLAAMRRRVVRIAPTVSREDLALNPYWREFRALPVADAEGRFLGVVRYETARRVLDEMAREHGSHPALDTVLSLGELYWSSLSDFLTAPRQGQAPAAGEHGGSSHVR